MQAHTIQLACAIVRAGDNASIITPDAGVIRERTPERAVAVIGPRDHPFAALRASLGATLIAVRPDHRAMGFPQAIAMRILGRASFVIQHNAPSSDSMNDPPRRLARVQHRIIDRAIAVSGAVRDGLSHRLGWPECSMVVRHNWTETDRFRPDAARGRAAREELGLPRDAWVVGTISRVNQQKRPLLMLEGFARFIDRCGPSVARARRAHLVWIGDGPLREPCAARARELGIQDRVHLVGPRDRPERWHPVFDLSLLTSSFEGFPLTMLECMACGVPMLANPVGGIAECIDDGRNGFIAAMEEPDDVAAALARVAGLDDVELARISDCARRTILERFTPEVAMSATLEAFSAHRAAEFVRSGGLAPEHPIPTSEVTT
ncbi:MAG: glycosyltransferase [Phycisphaerales bacterium]|nr:glycosyltransferase [Phycisphaerales bacterium]